MKKITSELFSTESDISRSLEIVYKEPEEDPKRKLSERYRHSSSSGNNSEGGGSLTTVTSATKLEKKKVSVTQIRKHEEETPEEAASGAISSHSPRTTSESSSGAYELRYTDQSRGTYPESVSPPSGKKTPSPTKLKYPSTAGGVKEQISEETISPVLEVRVKTPEKLDTTKYTSLVKEGR